MAGTFTGGASRLRPVGGPFNLGRAGIWRLCRQPLRQLQNEKVGPERWLGPLLEERAAVQDEPLSPLPPNFAQNYPDLGL